MANQKSTRSIILSGFLAFSLIFLGTSGLSRAAVHLVYFEGHGLDELIYLEWETATEIDTVGFNIWRSLTSVRGQLIGYEPAQGDSLTGGAYLFIDTNVVNETAYWYWLEEIDTNSASEFYGPIQVIAGVYETATVPPGTATRTATVTGTTSSSGSSATRTPTRTATRTQAAGGFNPTVTSPSLFLTMTPGGNPLSGLVTPLPEEQTPLSIGLTDTLTATITLIPLPEITMQFPTALAAAGGGADVEGSSADGAAMQPVRRTWLTLERLIFIGFLLLIWVLLGGWFFFSYRQLEK